MGGSMKTILLVLTTMTCVFAGAAQVVINEVLYDPDGTDTGKEKIELRNIGESVVDLTGYDLYPDGTGYFTFPSFSLSPGSLVVIHLRQTGTPTGAELFHATPVLNMGNTSGSVALFSGTTHNTSTLVSFVQWGGGSEGWASTAVAAGVWSTVSDSVPAVPEGHSLEFDGSGVTPADWFDQANPTIGALNSLPVQLLSFSARSSGAGVVLFWETVSEIDNFAFIIERRSIADSETEAGTPNEYSTRWSEIGIVSGSGTSHIRHQYSFVDSSPYPGRSAYRLRQVDRGGSFSFSEVLEIDRTDHSGAIQLDCFPNPFNPSVRVQFSVPDDGSATINLYDSAGRLVQSLFSGIATGGTEYAIALDGGTLASGAYVVACEFEGRRISRKILLIR